MNGNIFKTRLLATSVFAGVLGGMFAAPVLAQDVETIAAPAEEDAAVQETVYVTGSLIPQSGNLVSTSPVTEIGAADFDVRGVVRAEDMINSLPQAFGAQGSNLANGATGTSSVNLRGLGSTRTLTLLNGRRLPYGSLNTAAPDINFIPSALVKKVDILTGGASATYGSDAVSGVVNFILDTEFEGVRIDGNYSFFQHDNSNGYIQDMLSGYAANNPAQFKVPNGSVSDGETVDVTVAFGGKFDNGKGHMSGFASYQNTDEILQADRDYSQCALNTRNGGADFGCGGSSTNAVTNILDFAGNHGSPWRRVDPVAGTVIPRSFTDDTFNYNPYNHYQRPNERYSFGAFGNYDFNEYVTGYTELMFMDNRTQSQIAPSGVFGYGVTPFGGVNCDNPNLTTAQLTTICGWYGETAGSSAVVGLGSLYFLRRNVEGGNRFNDIRHSTFRGVIGIEGTLGDTPWGYDVNMIFANNHRSEQYQNDLSIRKMTNALYAVDDGAGNTVCYINADADPSNDDPACVPYNIFSGTPDPAATAYIVNPLFRDGEVKQTVVTAKTFADLGDYGVSSPMAESGVGFAVGVEYRRDFLDSNPDGNFQSGDGAGQGGSTDPISGSQEVYDVFAEANIPLIEDRPGIMDLGLDLAYRHSWYDQVDSDAYKIGLDYAPNSDVRFRASFQRAVRAANIFELYAIQSQGLFDLASYANGNYDPCSGATPFYSAAQCANTGVTAAQYGNIADNPAGQFNSLFGGNPNLAPEEADTLTLGFVATPSMIPGLTVSLDYFDIEVNGFVGTVPQQLALDQCATTGDAFYCSLINRGNGGTLWVGNTGYITATNINTGTLSTSGVDLLANYTYDLGAKGGLNFDYVGTFLESLETKPLPTSTSADIYDCVGFYAGDCGSSNPEYRHKASVTWNDAAGIFSVTGTWRYYGEVKSYGGAGGAINAKLDAQNYLDLSGSWQAKEWVSLRAGVNNLMDEEPPISSLVGTAPGNGNTYPQVYDAFGRYIFMGATFDF